MNTGILPSKGEARKMIVNGGISINKDKEVEKVKVDYEEPAVVLGRIQALQKEIAAGLAEFEEKYL